MNRGKSRIRRIRWVQSPKPRAFCFQNSIALGVLEAQFYEDDSIFAARKKYEADPAAARAVRAALGSSRSCGQGNASTGSTKRRRASGNDAGQRPALRLRCAYRKAQSWRLCATPKRRRPGRSNCSRPIRVAMTLTWPAASAVTSLGRWPLRYAGSCASGALQEIKPGGIAELQTTAAQGHLLAPFARILLAIAYVRENDLPRARELLRALQRDFPDNALFGRELARLDQRASR